MNEYFEVDARYHEGFVIEIYKGRYSLVAARQYTNKDGEEKIAAKWAEFEMKDKTKKRLPVAVPLGTNPVAILERVIKALSDAPAPVQDEDVPF